MWRECVWREGVCVREGECEGECVCVCRGGGVCVEGREGGGVCVWRGGSEGNVSVAWGGRASPSLPKLQRVALTWS